ncbi:MAG: hypothetical protein ACKOCJ_10420 [Burkholderiaceae bacterium]
MALVKKPRADAEVAHASHAPAGVNANAAREAEAQRRRARTLAKQQQTSERISAASTELSAGINEASSASEELKRASDQIATGSEEASAAAQQSLAALTQVTTSIGRQLQAVNGAQKRATGMQEQAAEINSGVKALVDNLTVATERQAESVKMVAELERQASNIGDIVNASDSSPTALHRCAAYVEPVSPRGEATAHMLRLNSFQHRCLSNACPSRSRHGIDSTTQRQVASTRSPQGAPNASTNLPDPQRGAEVGTQD